MIPEKAGRPRVAHLRRAISTAYYAVFCALCIEAGKIYPSPLDIAARRLVGHHDARDVLKRVKNTPKGRSFPWLPQGQVCDPDLRLFAQSFLELQEQRECADYDHDLIHMKIDATDAIALANDAIDQLERAKQNASVQVRAMCVAVIAKNRNRLQVR